MVANRTRHIAFDACFNFRDLGGYRTMDGRSVRWRSVFRSDALHRLGPADLEVLAELNVRTVIDLRSTPELLQTGRYTEAENITIHHVPVVEPDTVPPLPSFEPSTPWPEWGAFYLAVANVGAKALATALQLMSDAESVVVFHCTAGKDRTGILAALLLEILGVADTDILSDYALTDRCMGPKLTWAEANDPEWAALLRQPGELQQSSPIVMRTILDGLRSQHGTVTQFLLDAGLDPSALDVLRRRLLV